MIKESRIHNEEEIVFSRSGIGKTGQPHTPGRLIL